MSPRAQQVLGEVHASANVYSNCICAKLYAEIYFSVKKYIH